MEKKQNPWRTINSTDKYENDWIKVTHHNVENAANNLGVYGTVHFKNLAIGVIAVDKQCNTWLVGQWRYPLNAYSWEICEGGGKLDIDPLDSAKRELLEETGIKAVHWSRIQEIHTSNSVCDEFGIIYLAEELIFETPNPDEDEELTILKCSLKDVLRMVKEGKITDSLSLAGILKLHYLKPEWFK